MPGQYGDDGGPRRRPEARPGEDEQRGIRGGRVHLPVDDPRSQAGQPDVSQHLPQCLKPTHFAPFAIGNPIKCA